MSGWKSLEVFTPPFEERVLGLWENGHIEDVEFDRDDEGYVYHYLFDGETFSDNPSHWMPLPEPPK